MYIVGYVDVICMSYFEMGCCVRIVGRDCFGFYGKIEKRCFYFKYKYDYRVVLRLLKDRI